MGDSHDAGAVNDLQVFIDANPTIEFFRCQWIDYAGVPMVRVITKQYALSVERKKTAVTTPAGVQGGFLLDGSLFFDVFDLGEDRLWPDWSTLKVCHYAPGHASAMCFIEECGAQKGKGYRRCPRSRLQELQQTAKSKHDLEFLMGVEVEFQLMKPATESTPAQQVQTSSHPYSTASLRNAYLPVLEEIVSSLVKAGVQIRQFHGEGARGFFEITGEPLAPLEAADTLVFMQETIRSVCSNRGLHATLFPKPFEKSQSVGSHIHLSISRTEKEDSFLAGLLEKWTALAAFYMPNYDSYRRVRENEWVAWGLGNRLVPIRKINTAHWELRSADATMNPYLAFLAILTAGILGFETDKVLTMTDPKKFLVEPIIDEKEAAEYGIKERMSTSLKESLTKLKNDQELVGALGPEIIDFYLKVKEKEEAVFKKLTAEERKVICMGIF